VSSENNQNINAVSMDRRQPSWIRVSCVTPTSALLLSEAYGFTMGPSVCNKALLHPQKDSFAGSLLCPMLLVVMLGRTSVILTQM